ncbi:hypothetical protein SAMN05421670_3007 [Psychrobacillus psychrotolerans]|uniref:Uncharacterized protein n=1 Tax=Psychrobacillus psychrotolerans TaxID=126156 RepID=A0A1I5ZZW2_9BACI|nr:hypothetical protein [Psychrobacillus psychrotolerans]SFQ61893.1 hypothetical protein SAMN05421670_3007 [Psychrobacillus psychrotolerans]
MTKTNLEKSIERNIASYLQQNIHFDAEDEVSLKELQHKLTRFDIWAAAVCLITFAPNSKGNPASKATEYEKLRFIEGIADKIGYMIAQIYFLLKIATNRHLSPFHHLRFSGTSSVSELNLEYGYRNLKWINYASISKIKFIWTYASESNTAIHNYCPNKNTIFSSDKDRILEVEASKILHYLMSTYHQNLIPDLPKQDLWEPWMALYIKKV